MAKAMDKNPPTNMVSHLHCISVSIDDTIPVRWERDHFLSPLGGLFWWKKHCTTNRRSGIEQTCCAHNKQLTSSLGGSREKSDQRISKVPLVQMNFGPWCQRTSWCSWRIKPIKEKKTRKMHKKQLMRTDRSSVGMWWGSEGVQSKQRQAGV